MGDPGECEEAILKVTRQKRTVSQVFARLSLGVQYPLNALDDVIAMGQEELEKFDMCLKRHLAETRSGGPVFRRTERVKSHASKQFANHTAPVGRPARLYVGSLNGLHELTVLADADAR